MTDAQGNRLAAKISEAMLSTSADLVIMDAETREWSRFPWGEVHARAEAVAADLLDRADGPVGTLGLIGNPTVDIVASVLGAWLAGGSVSLFPGMVRGADLGRWAETTLGRCAQIGVRTIFSYGRELEQLRAVQSGVRTEDVARIGAKPRPQSFVPPRTGDDSTPAVLQNSSGSTGQPKTAILSRGAFLSNIAAVADRTLLGKEDVVCSWLPLYHDMGLITLVSAMWAGAPLWLAPSGAFSAAPLKWLDWITESGATYVKAPNFAYDIIGRYGDKIDRGVDLGTLRVAVSAAELIHCDSFERFLAATAPVGFNPGSAMTAYGLAEATCAVAASRPGAGARFDDVSVTMPDGGQSRRRYARLGAALDGMRLRIAPPAAPVPAINGREVGEIEVTGACMMNGYLGADPIRRDEWFKTGDLGYLLDGELVVVGRFKELIVLAGRNVYPTDIERAAASVEGVRAGRVAAVGLDEGGLRPRLALALEYKGSDLDTARRRVVQRVAADCGIVPAEVVFAAPGELPVTTSGKLRRLDVKHMIETGGGLR
ncbi:AMP-dependent synthetase and ligase [Segniliparus rotundus DSM 44985]|uniref:AMP-dependent synthetase and ligase n=1 Tax=Segniliparus rotundus (strain ATCC BAA-972 / CDC 1076 / CIP 108378 / DSM 44985 / JCM 13578) TaxID=640132 RepID=D6ZBA7_SEGRD|nr:long-chain-fatty acid--ACP ligase MbtM [Segniliparus rotundus]ADG96866.1 AMP-dependent synthetase and ligase [Segniliparus rotundus DSM 44985]